MPLRHQVPTLKLLALRVVAWPDGINRSGDIPFPNKQSRRHHKNLVTTLRRRGTVALNIPPKINPLKNILSSNDHIFKENLVEAIVNAWCRLSTFYETRLDELEVLKCIFIVGRERIKSLDLLFEGFFLRDGTDWKGFCGLIPYTLSPTKIDPFTWKSIIKVLHDTTTDKHIESLSFYMVGSTDTADESVFRFGTSLQGFVNLKKLVVHGDANDALMGAVGKHCHRLEYLDIRHTKVTEQGIILLIFNTPHIARRLRNNTAEYFFPEGILNPLTFTIKYLDMSTMHFKGTLMDRDHAIVYACRKLAPTPRRFFFAPGGQPRLYCQMDLSLRVFRSKVATALRSSLVDPFIELSRDLWPCLTQGFTHAEVRVNEAGEEVSFNYYNLEYLVIHLKLEKRILSEFTVHSANSLDFIPLELIQYLLPKLKHLKSSLKGLVDSSSALMTLKTVTCAVVYCKNTLISIIRNCMNLQYIEVRELFLAADTLTDNDVRLMLCDQTRSSIQVIRFLFPNQVTFKGLKTMCLACPTLEVVGDFKYWDTPLHILLKLKFNMHCHNFKFYFEYEGMLYATKTACKEL